MKLHGHLALVLTAAALTGGGAAQEISKKKAACTLPALRSIAAEIAGDDIEVFALARADQDPHYVSPNPRLMNQVRKVDLIFVIGLQLELWAPDVCNGSGNPRIFPGSEGHVVATRGVPREEIPTVAPSRSEGDVHPEGNPHLWIDPLRAKGIAENMAAAFKKIAPDKAKDFDARLDKFRNRIDESVFGPELVKLVGSKKLTRLAQDGELWTYLESNEAEGAKLVTRVGGWLKKAEPLRGQPVIEFHKTWIYLAKLLGFQIVGAIESKPGIEPGPRHQADLIELAKSKKVRLILVDNFYDLGKPRYLSAQTGARVVILPNQPGGETGTENYFSFIDYVIAALNQGLKEGK